MRTRTTHATSQGPMQAATGKLVAVVLVVACIAIGVLGLLLPIIPGLLFLALAALVAARHFPAVGRRLRRHGRLGGYLDRGDRYLDLGWRHKLEVAGLVCVKLLLDGIALAGKALGRARNALADR